MNPLASLALLAFTISFVTTSDKIARANIAPVGEEIPLFNDFDGVPSTVHTAANDDGSFVVAWIAPPSVRRAVFLRRFDADGNAVGADIEVNADTTGTATPVLDVASDGNGRVIVTWFEADVADSYPTPKAVLARAFDASGNALSSTLTLATVDAYGVTSSPRVAIGPRGEAAVVWAENKHCRVLVQRLSSKPAAIGGPIVLQEYEFFCLSPANLAISYLEADDFVVGWAEGRGPEGCRGSETAITMQRVLDGTPTGDSMQPRYDFPHLSLCTLADGNHGFDIASQGPGEFVVVNDVTDPGYYDYGDYPHYWDPYPSSYGFHTQRFVDDKSQGSQRVGDASGGYPPTLGLSVATGGRGNYLVVWAANLQAEGHDSDDVFASPFSCRGRADTPFGFRVNEDVTGNQYFPDVAAIGDDDFLVTWTAREETGPRRDVFARRYTFTGACSTCGDADDDGEITVSDALSALRGSVGFAGCEPALCDVNSDDDITATDALAILTRAVGLDVVLACPVTG